MRLWVNLDDFPRIGHHRKDSIETINVCRNNVEVVSVLVPAMSVC